MLNKKSEFLLKSPDLRSPRYNLEDLKREVLNLEIEHSAVIRQINQKKPDLLQIKKIEDQLKKNREFYENEVKNLQDYAEELMRDIDLKHSAHVQHSSFSSTQEVPCTKCYDLQGKLRNTEQELNSAQEDLRGSRNLIEKLSFEVDNIHKKQSLMNKDAELQKIVDSYEQKIEEMTYNHDKQTMECFNNCQAMINEAFYKLQKSLSALDSKLKLYEGKMNILENDSLKIVGQKDKKIYKLTEKIQEIHGKLQETEGLIKTLEEEKSTMYVNLENSNKIQDELKKENQILVHRTNSLTGLIRQESEETVSEISSRYTQEVNDLKTQISVLNNNCILYERNIKDKNSEINDLEQENFCLQENNKTLTENTNDLNNKILDLENTHSHILDQLEIYKTDIDTITKEKDYYLHTNNELRTELKKTKHDLSSMKENLDDLRNELKISQSLNLKTRSLVLESSYFDTNDDIKQEEKYLASFEQQHMNDSKTTERQNSIRKYESQIIELAEEKEALENKINLLQEQNLCLETSIKSLSSELISKNELLASSANRINHLNQEIQKQNEICQTTQEKYNDSLKESKSLKINLQNAQQESSKTINSLSEELDSANKIMKDKDFVIEEQRQSIDRLEAIVSNEKADLNDEEIDKEHLILIEETAQLKLSLETLNSNKQNLEEELAKHQNQINCLKEELDLNKESYQVHLKSLDSTIVDLESTKQVQSRQIESLLDKLNKDSSSHSLEIKEKEERIKQLEMDFAQLKNKMFLEIEEKDNMIEVLMQGKS